MSLSNGFWTVIPFLAHSLLQTLSLLHHQPFQESSAVFTSDHTNTNFKWVNDNHLSWRRHKEWTQKIYNIMVVVFSPYQPPFSSSLLFYFLYHPLFPFLEHITYFGILFYFALSIWIWKTGIIMNCKHLICCFILNVTIKFYNIKICLCFFYFSEDKCPLKVKLPAMITGSYRWGAWPNAYIMEDITWVVSQYVWSRTDSNSRPCAEHCHHALCHRARAGSDSVYNPMRLPYFAQRVSLVSTIIV